MAKLRKATIGFVMSVRPHVRLSAWNNSDPTGRIFMKFDMSIFRNTVEKIQVSLKSDKNNGYYTWRPLDMWSYLTQFLFEREMFQKVVGEIEIRILCSITFLRKSRLYEIMWKNTEEPGKPQVTICRTRIACWITKVTHTHTHTHTICNTYWLSTATTVARTRPTVTLYAQFMPCCL